MSNFNSAPDSYKNKTCSRATMRNQDLIPALLTWHRDVCPDEYAGLMACPFGPIPSHAQDDDRDDWWDSEDATALCSQLFDDLDAVAPAGYYFGAHPGDGSDFGYWQVESDDEHPAPAQLIPVCTTCGSTDITRDACARWDVSAQAWTMAGTYDDATCQHCTSDGNNVYEMRPLQETAGNDAQ